METEHDKIMIEVDIIDNGTHREVIFNTAGMAVHKTEFRRKMFLRW